MNYRNAATAELNTVIEEFEAYSIGQVILAVLKRKPEDTGIGEWLMSVSDEDLYTSIETTKLKERI